MPDVRNVIFLVSPQAPAIMTTLVGVVSDVSPREPIWLAQGTRPSLFPHRLYLKLSFATLDGHQIDIATNIFSHEKFLVSKFVRPNRSTREAAAYLVTGYAYPATSQINLYIAILAIGLWIVQKLIDGLLYLDYY